MEVGFPDFDEDPYAKHPKNWEPVGKTIFWGSFFLAVGAAAPAFFKKKRVYTALAPTGENGAAAAQDAVLEADPSVPAPLRCSQEAKARVVELFTTIADGNIVLNGLFLQRLGAQIEEEDRIHPFSFIMAMPRDKIRDIFNSSNFVYKLPRIPAILGGIERGMIRERNHLDPFISYFATQMSKEAEPIRQLIQAADWERLVHYLFDIGV